MTVRHFLKSHLSDDFKVFVFVSVKIKDHDALRGLWEAEKLKKICGVGVDMLLRASHWRRIKQKFGIELYHRSYCLFFSGANLYRTNKYLFSFSFCCARASLRQLLPIDMVKAQSPDDWKRVRPPQTLSLHFSPSFLPSSSAYRTFRTIRRFFM